MRDETNNALTRQLDLLAQEELQRQGGGHPSTERLTAYRAGELPPAEVDELQDHLAVCRECAQTVRDLPHFLELMEAREIPSMPAGTGSVPTPAQTEASWESFRARLAPELAQAGGPRQPAVERLPQRPHPPRAWRSRPAWVPA
jgi:anti-sigma factor ChrR (cupin superfamily)